MASPFAHFCACIQLRGWLQVGDGTLRSPGMTKFGELEAELSVGLPKALVRLFEEFPDTLFWVKDRALRIVAVNEAFVERVGRCREDIIGETDAAFYFAEMARVFMEDDARVMETGQPIIDKTELLANQFGEVEWRQTTKLPLFDATGNIYGTAGISCPLMKEEGQLPAHYRTFDGVVRTMRQNLDKAPGLEEIARQAGMSRATLTRRFREALGVSPGVFLQQLRLSRACHLLAASLETVTQIALSCGYESPAAFARAFQRQTGTSPRDYRRQWHQRRQLSATREAPVRRA